MKDAIYIPAYSDGLMSMFYSLDDDGIAKKYQPDLNKRNHYESTIESMMLISTIHIS